MNLYYNRGNHDLTFQADMPFPTPFHPRTDPLCESREWRNWSGFLSAVTYQSHHESEYYAIRNSVGVIDVSPLYKYEVIGPQAERLVDRIMTRDLTQCRVGQVYYSPWCDEDGKVIDDGTISRLGQNRYRITAADPNLRWFQDCGFGLEAQVSDISDQLAALALQGPNSAALLMRLLPQPDLIANLRYYHLIESQIADIPLTITRTGYTGDLGYELWVDPAQAVDVWDALYGSGQDYGLTACGLAALDITRIEAGLLLIEVDYISSHAAVIDSQKSTPYEIGLGWTVNFGAADFIGRKALEVESGTQPKSKFVGFVIDWPAMEDEFGKVGLPPQVSGRARREPLPVYQRRRQIGQATSITFSPILKKYIAIGTIAARSAIPGNQVDMEITVEYARRTVPAVISDLPFFNPSRKRKLPK